MKTAKFIVLTAGLVILAGSLASCCGCRKTKSKVQLVGTEWKMSQIGRSTVDAASGFTLSLSTTGRVSGMGSCNRFTGTFTQKKHELRIAEGMVSTRMMCRDQTLEDRYFAMLRRVDSYSIDGERLMLIAGGEVLAIFDPVPAPEPQPEPEPFRPLGPPILVRDSIM